jgi:hypothetical protein
MKKIDMSDLKTHFEEEEDNLKKINFSALENMSDNEIFNFYSEEISYKKQEPTKFYDCLFKVLGEIEPRIKFNRVEIEPHIKREDFLNPQYNQVQLHLITKVYYDLDGSNSEEILSKAWSKLSTSTNIRKYNKCQRESLPPNWKVEGVWEKYSPSLRISPYFKLIQIPSEKLIASREKSEYYKDFKKYIGKKIPYPGDENSASFIDKILQIKGSKPDSESKGEKLVRIFLETKGVNFTQYYRIKECFSELNGKCYTLPFDFFIPETKVLIEYDGEQHFRPVEKFGGEKTYQRQVKLDLIKNEFSNMNGFKLIRIPYTVKNENQLKNYLPDDVLGILKK